jgi:hypothetical protein
VAQGGFGVLVDQFTGGDQVPRHRIGGGPVQRAQFAANLGRELPGVDVGRYRRPLRVRAISAAGSTLRLSWAGTTLA